MRKSPQRRIYYDFLLGQLLTTWSDDTEVAQWAARSCSRRQPYTDNDARDGRSNRLAVSPPLYKARHDWELIGWVIAQCKSVQPLPGLH